MKQTSTAATNLLELLGGAEEGQVTRLTAERHVEVALDRTGERLQAKLAAFGYDDPRKGDIVLVLKSSDRAYVIGVIRALRETAESDDGSDRLRVTYDAEKSLNEISLERGDLRLSVADGRVEIDARDGVSIASQQDVTLSSQSAVRLESTAAGAERGSSLRVDGAHIDAQTAEHTISASQASIIATTTAIVTRQYELRADRVRNTARVLETRATRLVEKSVNSYREIERLAQMKAGRIRSIAAKSAKLYADTMLFRSEKNVRVRGEKIYLD